MRGEGDYGTNNLLVVKVVERGQHGELFRFFKHILGCRHLLSTDPIGIEVQVYCAIIACLLISLWTKRKPSLRTYEMIYLYLKGWADEEEVLRHTERLPAH